MNWLNIFKKKQEVIMVSLDHLNDLRKHVEFIEERVKRLEVKSQLKQSGELKVIEPIKKNRKVKKFLSSDEREQMRDEYLAGLTVVRLAKKYNVHYTTALNIINEKDK